MTTPFHNSFNYRDDGRDGDRSHRDQFFPETMFVASFLFSLRERESDTAKALASDLVELGPITGQDFSRVISEMNHQETILEVLDTVHSLLRPDTRHDVVEMVPTLIALSEKLVLAEKDCDPDTGDRLTECFARVVGVLEDDRNVCRRAREELGSEDLNALRRIAQKGVVARDGYWTAVVLQCVLDPSPESLHYLDHGIVQLDKDATPDDLVLVSVRRGVSAIAEKHFSDVLEWLGAKSETESNKWAMAEATLGLCEQAAPRYGDLMRFLIEGDRGEKLVACTASMFLGQDERFGLSKHARRELTSVLGGLAHRGQSAAPADFLTQTATRALLHVTTREDDVRRVHRYIVQLLEKNVVPSPELAFSYASAVARIRETEPRRPVISYGDRSTQPTSEELKANSMPESPFSAAAKPQDPVRVIDDFVASITAKTKIQVISACEALMSEVLLKDLTPRSEVSDNLFASEKEALRFIRRYNFILDQSLFEVGALLLPELLSIVEQSIVAPRGALKSKLMLAAIEGLEQIAYNLASRPALRDVAQRRLSAGDLELLDSLPGRTLEGDYNVPIELSTAALGVSMALGSSQQWQDVLLTLWRESPIDAKEDADSSILSFFGVNAERRFPGSTWTVLSKASVWRDDREFLRCMTYGLLGNPEYAARVCELVESEKGEDLSKGFTLAQAMQAHLSEAQREQVLKKARSMVDEMGVLGLDAIVTVSSLSRSLEDVRFLLTLPSGTNIDEKLHHVTCFDGVARILRNVRNSGKKE